jgi:hypothetical protein
LIVILRDSGLGYNMSDVCCGCILFAADILLLSASVCKLQTMLNLCITFASAVDLKFIHVKYNVLQTGLSPNSILPNLDLADNVL